MRTLHISHSIVAASKTIYFEIKSFILFSKVINQKTSQNFSEEMWNISNIALTCVVLLALIEMNKKSRISPPK